MELTIGLIFVLMMATTLIYFLIDNHNNKDMLKKRKSQSLELLRENVIKKRIEKLSKEKVKFSKRYNIETMCLQAGFKLTYAEFKMISVAVGLLLAIVVGTIMNNFILGVLFFVIGNLAPKQLVHFLKNLRLDKMERQIGAFMQMILKRYEVSKDFSKSLELTTVEFKGEEPLYSELKQTVVEVNLGTPIVEAMDELARRTGNKYMQRLSDYYKIASSLGTEDARKKLLTQAYVQFEENRRAKATMKKQLSEPKREAYIMLASIPMFALYQITTNPSYVDFMTKTMTGKIGTTVICAVFIGCLWFINQKIGAPIE